MMPKTQSLDLNPVFTSLTSFRPAGDGGALQLFAQVNIPLVHGWLVDPSSPEYPVLKRVRDYDNAVMLIAEVDHLTRGKFVVDDNAIPHESPESPGVGRMWTEEERAKIEDAVVVKRFLDSTSGQLTYHGLFHLATTLQPGSLVALFVNSHLSVLYKSPGPRSRAQEKGKGVEGSSSAGWSNGQNGASSSNQLASSSSSFSPGLPTASSPPSLHSENQESALYTLATDQVFLHESSIVWERLEDIDGGWSTFVDAEFVKAVPVGGDWAGDTVEGVLRRTEMVDVGEVDMVDHALARQLQAEEHEHYVQEQQRRRNTRLVAQQEIQDKKEQREKEKREKKERKKAKGDCVIM
ncbi:hypothetical protein B0H34DRAFT_194107 [Crassisporium funariophilum]|nr:hypothetical protein B0H34DRAFT_194107 [Crassisporium funariophilum]